jgi:hypothetical protein
MLPSVSLGGVFDPGPFDIGVFDTVQTGITFTPFLQLQGSNNQVGWATLYNTPIAGTLNEVITSVSSSLVGGNFKFHQVVVQGDGIQTARISQIQMSVSDTGQNEW